MEFDEATLQQIEQELSQLDPTILQYFQQIQAEDTEEARKIIDNALGSIPPEEQLQWIMDNYNDNLCLWMCIAVHRGARPDRCTTTARLLAKAFFRFNDVL